MPIYNVLLFVLVAVIIFLSSALIYVINIKKSINFHEKELVKSILLANMALIKIDAFGRIRKVSDQDDGIFMALGIDLSQGDHISRLITRMNLFINMETPLSEEDIICNEGEKTSVVRLEGLKSNITYYEIRSVVCNSENIQGEKFIYIKDITAEKIASLFSEAIIEVSTQIFTFKKVEDMLLYFSNLMEEIIDIDYVIVGITMGEAQTYAIDHVNKKKRSKVTKIKGIHPIVKWMMKKNDVVYMNEEDLANIDVDIFSQLYEGEKVELMSCPIRVDGYRYAGTLILLFKEKTSYPDLILTYLSKFAKYTGMYIEKHKIKNKIFNMAYYDHLTGLPNSLMFENRLEEAIIKKSLEGGAILGILIVKLPGIKRINDMYGHIIGDMILKKIGATLQEACNDKGYVARIGGDEYGVFLTLTSKEAFEGLAEELLHRLDKQWIIEGHLIHMTVHIGLSFYGEHGIEPRQLIVCAGAALKEIAKDQNREYDYRIFR